MDVRRYLHSIHRLCCLRGNNLLNVRVNRRRLRLCALYALLQSRERLFRRLDLLLVLDCRTRPLLSLFLAESPQVLNNALRVFFENPLCVLTVKKLLPCVHVLRFRCSVCTVPDGRITSHLRRLQDCRMLRRAEAVRVDEFLDCRLRFLEVRLVDHESREVRHDRCGNGACSHATKLRAGLDDLCRRPCAHCVIVRPLNDLVLFGGVADITAHAVIEDNVTLWVVLIPVDDHIAFLKLIRVKRNDIISCVRDEPINIDNTV